MASAGSLRLIASVACVRLALRFFMRCDSSITRARGPWAMMVSAQWATTESPMMSTSTLGISPGVWPVRRAVVIEGAHLANSRTQLSARFGGTTTTAG
jgi:hypothetical protein